MPVGAIFRSEWASAVHSCGTTYFDPNTIAAGIPDYIGLSNRSLTVTAGTQQGSSGNYGRAWALEAKLSGNYYWEVTVDAYTGGQGSCGIGEFVDVDESGNWGIAGVEAIGTNGGLGHSAFTIATGDVVGFAVSINSEGDTGDCKVWMHINNVWQGDGDPTGLPLRDFGASTDSKHVSFVPYVQPLIGDQFTANFGRTPYVYAAPAGFGNWTITGGYVGSVNSAPPNDLGVDVGLLGLYVPYIDLTSPATLTAPNYSQKLVSKFTFPTCRVSQVILPLFDLNSASLLNPFTHFPRFSAVIYTDNAGVPANLVAQSPLIEVGRNTDPTSGSFNSDTVFDWGFYRFPIAATLAAGDYWLGVVGDAPIGGYGGSSAIPFQMMTSTLNGAAYAVNVDGNTPDASFGAASFADAQFRVQAFTTCLPAPGPTLGLVAAYSQRAVSPARLNMPLYRIRRDSDNQEQTFNADAITGDAPVAAIASFVGESNALITTWFDQSASAVDVFQSTMSIQPSYVASAHGGRPGIFFPSIVTSLVDGTGPVFQLTSTGSLTFTHGGMSFFIVLKVQTTDLGGNGPDGFILHSNFIFATTNPDTNAGIDTVVAFNFSNDPTTSLFDSEIFDGANGGGGGDSAVDPALVDQYIIIDGIADNGLWDVKRNGSSLTRGPFPSDTGFPVQPFSAGPITIGADGPGEILPLDALLGTLQEVRIYSGIMTDADRATLRADCAAYYGITL